MWPNLTGGRRSTLETLKQNAYVSKPLVVPKAVVPRVTPYVANRERLGLGECLRQYRQIRGLSYLEQKRSSDTLSILASGSSINELDDDDFAFIDSTDSLAMNWWSVYHDLVPDFYSIEFLAHDELNTKLIDGVNERLGETSTEVTLLFEPETLLNEGRCVTESLSRLTDSLRRDPVELRVFQYFVDADHKFPSWTLKRLFPTVFNDRLLHFRGSISHLLSLARVMDYDDVVLFGVDLDDSEYFFGEHPVWEFKQRPDPDDEHVTATRDRFRGVDQYIRFLDSELLSDGSPRLHIGSRESALYPSLDFFRDSFDL